MATLTIRFTETASQDFDDILGFIAEANPEASSKLSLRIMQSLERLSVFPASSRQIPEAPDHPARELVVAPLIRVFCRVNEEAGELWVIGAMRAEQAFHPEILDT